MMTNQMLREDIVDIIRTGLDRVRAGVAHNAVRFLPQLELVFGENVCSENNTTFLDISFCSNHRIVKTGIDETL